MIRNIAFVTNQRSILSFLGHMQHFIRLSLVMAPTFLDIISKLHKYQRIHFSIEQWNCLIGLSNRIEIEPKVNLGDLVHYKIIVD